MKHIKKFNSFVVEINLFSGKSQILEEIINESNNNYAVNEASKADFKPSKTMLAHAIGGNSTIANSAIQFATAVAQQWDELEDSQKSEAAEKWSGMKGKFKKQVAKLTAKADGGDNRAKGELDEVSYSKRKEVQGLWDSKIEPLYKDAGEKTVNDSDKIKAEIEKFKTELENVKSEIENQVKIRDDKGFGSDEGKAAQKQIGSLVDKENEIEGKIDALEGKLDDEE